MADAVAVAVAAGAVVAAAVVTAAVVAGVTGVAGHLIQQPQGSEVGRQSLAGSLHERDQVVVAIDDLLGAPQLVQVGPGRDSAEGGEQGQVLEVAVVAATELVQSPDVGQIGVLAAEEVLAGQDRQRQEVAAEDAVPVAGVAGELVQEQVVSEATAQELGAIGLATEATEGSKGEQVGAVPVVVTTGELVQEEEVAETTESEVELGGSGSNHGSGGNGFEHGV